MIPAYQAAPLIADTLASVAAQTDAPHEVIVIDDGSDDGTGDVALTFADRIAALRVERQANAGPASARNRGLELAGAPYICFLDADDILDPDALRQQADFLDANPDVALVYSSVVEFGEIRAGEPVIGHRPADPPEPLHERLLEGTYGCVPSAAMQRRESVQAIGGFAQGFESGEDYDFYVRLAFAGFRMAHAATPPLRYRIHPGQRSGNAILSRAEVIDALTRLYSRMPRDHPSRSKLVARLRYLRLIQAGELDRAGRTTEARHVLLANLRSARRPGHLLETARLFARPALVFEGLDLPPRPLKKTRD